MLGTLIELGLTDDWRHMEDKAIIRRHSQAADAKGSLKEGFGRSHDGFTSKIHARFGAPGLVAKF